MMFYSWYVYKFVKLQLADARNVYYFFGSMKFFELQLAHTYFVYFCNIYSIGIRVAPKAVILKHLILYRLVNKVFCIYISRFKFSL